MSKAWCCERTSKSLFLKLQQVGQCTSWPVDIIVVKGWGATHTGQTRLKGWGQQSSLGGWHTLRLGPGSRAEKWCKSYSTPKPANIEQKILQTGNQHILSPVTCQTAKSSIGRSRNA